MLKNYVSFSSFFMKDYKMTSIKLKLILSLYQPLKLKLLDKLFIKA